MPRQRGWLPRQLSPFHWQARDANDRAGNAAEQDEAAGGHVRRLLATEDGRRVPARVRFNRKPGARRTYAYLVWREHGSRREVLVGEATAAGRHANLVAAWGTVHHHELTTVQGRVRWRQRDV